jgi:small subunit ribosomal protein S11
MVKKATKASKGKKEKGNVPTGIIHIQSTFNNTIITVTDVNGNVVATSSTPFAAQLAAQDALRQAMELGMRMAEVRVKGPGVGREAALRALQAEGFTVSVIRDVTPIPHNGCRPPKRRRV